MRTTVPKSAPPRSTAVTDRPDRAAPARPAEAVSHVGGSGRPLAPDMQRFMGSRLGVDMRQVRIHTDDRAAAAAKALHARAFSVGRDIVQRAEIDDADCGSIQDSSALFNTLLNGVLQAASTIQDGEQRVDYVYRQLGVGSPFSKIEQFCDALPETHQRRLSIAQTRFAGPESPRGSNAVVNAWSKGDRTLGTLLNIGGVCIGGDKLGHFFQQGREYFRISVSLGQGHAVAEDYGRWLEGLDPEQPVSAAWIADMQKKGWPGWDKLSSGRSVVDWVGGKLGMLDVSKGVYGLATTGVFSRADLSANRAGMSFYEAVNTDPRLTIDVRKIVDGTWNERTNSSCFGPEMARLVAAHDLAFQADLASSYAAELERVKAYIDTAWTIYQRDEGAMVDTSEASFKQDMLARAPAMVRATVLNRHLSKYLCK